MSSFNAVSYPKEDDLIRLRHEKLDTKIWYQPNGDSSPEEFSTSPDIFVNLNRDNNGPYRVCRQLNIGIDIDPASYSIETFLSDFITGTLDKTKKCQYHGDAKTGLNASEDLLVLLGILGPSQSFNVKGVEYAYHSIGVAANPRYAPAASSKKASHFQIKFRGVFAKPPYENLRLNIHLVASEGSGLGKDHVLKKLSAGIAMFCHELSLAGKTPLSEMHLLKSFNVTLDNFRENGFHIWGERGKEVYFRYKESMLYTKKDSSLLEKFFEVAFRQKSILKKDALIIKPIIESVAERNERKKHEKLNSDRDGPFFK